MVRAELLQGQNVSLADELLHRIFGNCVDNI